MARTRSWEADLRWSHWLGVAAWAAVAALVHRQIVRQAPDADPYLVPTAMLLAGWGLLAIWRLDPAFGLRQTMWLAVAAVVFFLGLKAPQNLDLLRRYKYVFLSSGLLLTALTLVFGSNPGGIGPRLWLGCCGIYLQPSEPLKLLLVAYLAAYFAERIPIRSRLVPLLFPTLVIAGLALSILLIQRDLGTASIFIFLYSATVYLASGKRRLLLGSLGILLLAALTGYFFVDIIRIRLSGWLDPWSDPSGRSYQIIQSILAVANGGMIGRGIGMGAPGLVPVAHSDFIYTSISEEFGILGTSGLLILLGILVTRGFFIAIRAGSNFRRLLAAGIAAYFGAQSILIIGGNLRLLPLTGVTLPFVSYGGSSLLTSFLALLTLMQISNELEEEPAALPRPQPYLHMSALIWLGLLGCALSNGWWAIWRTEDLLNRTDNPRRTIADRFVRRGALFDRQNRAITVTTGEPGEFTRTYIFPSLAPISGYTDPIYGQAGLEESLDPYLRGTRGNPALLIWWEHLLYGQPPGGLDVRLSIDLDIQQVADDALSDHTGAIILINAATGEILAMASHPTYDPNRLAEIGPSLNSDPNAPLLNRATQGIYPTNNTLAPFQFAALGSSTATTEELTNLYSRLGFYSAPALSLPVSPAASANNLQPGLNAVQMVIAAAALSHQGICPVPQLAMAVNSPQQGWIILPPGSDPTQCLPAEGAQRTAETYERDDRPFWEHIGLSKAGQKPITWYLSGTSTNWQGTPLALVIVLEENNTLAVRLIADRILDRATQP